MAVDLSMPVLVVDDYSTMIRIIRNLLKQLGFENIDDASDGSAALNKMRGKAGVNNYIVKPFNAATLKTKIEAVFPDMATA